MRDRTGSNQVSEVGEMQKSRMAPPVGVWGTEWITEPPAETRQQEEELVWILGFGGAPGMTRWKCPEGS